MADDVTGLRKELKVQARLHIHDLYRQNKRLPLLHGTIEYSGERLVGRAGGVPFKLRGHFQISNSDHRKTLTRFLCSAHCPGRGAAVRHQDRRRGYIARELRLCCRGCREVEDEVHALWVNDAVDELRQLRQKFWADLADQTEWETAAAAAGEIDMLCSTRCCRAKSWCRFSLPMCIASHASYFRRVPHVYSHVASI